jgi:segregation and condensation protein A
MSAAEQPGIGTTTDRPMAALDAPGIAFVDRRRPEDATRVRLPEWEGPLGLLLALVEARRLDVMTVPLGALAEAYLDAMAGLDGDRMANLSAFVSVASQLILIKSRELLPRPPEPPVPLEDDGDVEAALRARLIAYRAFRDAADRLAAPAGAGRQAVRRDPSIALATARAGAVEPLPPRLDPALLVAALDRLAAVAPAVALPPETIERTVSLAERADLIRAALRNAGPIVLQELLAGVRDRVVVAVTFLAMLELVKQREVVVEQDAPWGPIIVRTIPPGAGAGSAAATVRRDEEDA